MARARAGTAELSQVLNAVPQPIYVLDDEQTIVFCNRACLEWLGRKEEELQGRRCGYHSSPDAGGADAVAAGLCPPPVVLEGRELTATIGGLLGDGRLECRRARFIPLGGAESVAGLLAIVERDELSPSASAPPSDDPWAQLHERIRAFRREAASRWRADRLAGDSPAMRRARAQLDLATASRASVLLFGPPGSGRQHVAAAIHYGTPEPVGPLVPLSCGLLSGDTIRSTLAALAARPPEPRRCGTLLLTDADRLAEDVQAETAAILSAKTFPLRPVATAEEPLLELARRGQYREDLAAVLSTVVIELPALAQRRADLPLLVQLFIEESNLRSGKQVAGLSSEAMAWLDGYSWPGNVDELIHVLVEAHERAEGREIGVRDLPERIHLARQAAAHPHRPEPTIILDEFLARIERELIQRAFERAKGNKAKAARLLGMTRPRLYRRLIQLGLEKEDTDK